MEWHYHSVVLRALRRCQKARELLDGEWRGERGRERIKRVKRGAEEYCVQLLGE
jgi:hypothetical protein